MQLAQREFMFEIITDSYNFKKYSAFAEKHNLIRDVCCYKDVDKKLEIDDYLKVVQKSPLWLHLRNLASGTASSLGKYIKGPPRYPTIEQVSEAWSEKICKKPFEVTHTMAGHMTWGVGYEDPALVHFACENYLAVAQVGTIKLPFSFIKDIAPDYLTKEELKLFSSSLELLESLEEHFLVSPDGVVGEAKEGDAHGDIKSQLPEKIIGMLEIKCISPFHHIETDDGYLTWADNMEKRQWHKPGEIPYVYVTQTCLQAISGLCRLNMTDKDTMWFIRWSPIGFSEFKISFQPLVKMGILSCLLFLMLKNRIKSESDLPLVYTPEELRIVKILDIAYTSVITNMTHRYVNHANLYECFKTYYKVTERFNFKVSKDR